MKVKVSLLLISFFLLASNKSWAQDKFVERSTDVLCVVPTATGLIKAVVEKDKKGMIQLGLSTATTLALNYGLEAIIKKDRPDGTGHHAFPSTHAAIAFDGATFLMKRYGWQWGVPAYALSAYVAWGRVHADRHDWWDVLGGAALGAGCALIYTRSFAKEKEIVIVPSTFGDHSAGVTASGSYCKGSVLILRNTKIYNYDHDDDVGKGLSVFDCLSALRAV